MEVDRTRNLGVLQPCVVCQAPNHRIQLGLDMCRACSVFYRRARGRKYPCRKGTQKCSIQRGQEWPCKCCRMNKIQLLLCESAQVHSTSPSSSDSSEYANRQGITEIWGIHDAGPILTRLQGSYNELCRRRHALESLEWESHNENVLWIAASSSACSKVSKILLDASPLFAGSAFDEFHTLLPNDQVVIAQNFFRTFNIFDNFFRSMKCFPGTTAGRNCMGLTRYCDWSEIDGSMFDRAPSRMFVSHALNYVKSVNKDMQTWKPVLERLALTGVEFLACVGILLWDVSGRQGISDELFEVAERQKRRILHELHLYYKKEAQMADYSARIGEIFMFFQHVNRCSAKLTEMFGLFKMLDVLDEETAELMKAKID